MEHVKKIFVSIQFSENEIELEELVSEGRDIYFKYYTDLISKEILHLINFKRFALVEFNLFLLVHFKAFCKSTKSTFTHVSNYSA